MALPLQILPQEETFGARLGTGLGVGISSGLQNLADLKMKELARRQVTQGLQAPSLGFSPEEAQALSGLDTTSLNQILKQRAAQPQQAAYAQAISSILGGEQPGQEAPQLAGLTEQQATNLGKFVTQQRKFEQGERKEAREYLAPFEEKHQRIEQAIRSNNQLIQLSRSGNLRAGYKQKLLDKLDLGNFWQPIENELAQKNLARQATNAGAAFNTKRLTNLEVGTYKQSLATLWNTPEGIEAIARVNNLEFKADEARHKARRNIIKDNKGQIPFDIESQIEDRVQPQLKHYADKSMKIVMNAINKTPGKNVAKRKNQFASINDVPTKNLPVGAKFIDNTTKKEYDWNGSSWKAL